MSASVAPEESAAAPNALGPGIPLQRRQHEHTPALAGALTRGERRERRLVHERRPGDDQRVAVRDVALLERLGARGPNGLEARDGARLTVGVVEMRNPGTP